MVIELLHSPTLYSKFSPTAVKGVRVHRIDCSGKAIRKGNRLLLTVIATYNLNDFSTDTIHEVLKSETKYQVLTDGFLDVEGLYEVYEHGMVCLLRGLHDLEINSRIQPTKDLHPLPLTGKLLELVQSQVDAFNMGLTFNEM